MLGIALVLLVATLMGGLAPQGCGPATNFAPSSVALAGIPGNYLGWIRAAAPRYDLDWTVIAGIYSIETDFGRLDAPGVRSGENFAGAGGPGQFLSATWARYNGDGLKDLCYTTQPTRSPPPRTCCARTAPPPTTTARSSP